MSMRCHGSMSNAVGNAAITSGAVGDKKNGISKVRLIGNMHFNHYDASGQFSVKVSRASRRICFGDSSGKCSGDSSGKLPGEVQELIGEISGEFSDVVFPCWNSRRLKNS